jgi:hypothetical protein
MKQQSWIVRRCTLQTTDAQLRWDRAYQALVHGSMNSTGESSPSPIEEGGNHESRDVCTCLAPFGKLLPRPSNSKSSSCMSTVKGRDGPDMKSICFAMMATAERVCVGPAWIGCVIRFAAGLLIAWCSPSLPVWLASMSIRCCWWKILNKEDERREFVDQPMSQNPHDQLLLQIRGAVAEYERSVIAERMRRGRRQKYQAGSLLPWTRPPYGYRVDPAHPREVAGVRIEPAEAAVVSDLFVHYLQEGQTLQGVTKGLITLEIPTPSGHWRWNQATVRGILTNPAYTGTVYLGRSRPVEAHRRHSAFVPIGRGRGGHKQTPQEEWIAVAQVPALVSQEQFEQVQAKLAHNQQFARRNNTAHPYLLRALVSCGHCHLGCNGRCSPGGSAYYVCLGRNQPVVSHRDEKCSARSIVAEQLDEVVWQDVCEVLTHPESIASALQQAQRGQWLPQALQARRENLRHPLA